MKGLARTALAVAVAMAAALARARVWARVSLCLDALCGGGLTLLFRISFASHSHLIRISFASHYLDDACGGGLALLLLGLKEIVDVTHLIGDG